MKRGLHHLHFRKRIYQKMEKYPHPEKGVRILDKIILMLAVIAPLFEVPQLWEIYSSRAAENVSLITWSFFALMAVPWFFYGIVHKEKPIIILYFLWFLIDSAIVVGILIYS